MHSLTIFSDLNIYSLFQCAQHCHNDYFLSLLFINSQWKNGVKYFVYDPFGSSGAFFDTQVIWYLRDISLNFPWSIHLFISLEITSVFLFCTLGFYPIMCTFHFYHIICFLQTQSSLLSHPIILSCNFLACAFSNRILKDFCICHANY